jgi:mono/diheme cytochrome c family protein
LRRYLPTLILLFILFVAGGSFILLSNQHQIATSGFPLFFQKVRGYYLPTFTTDTEGQTLSLIFVGSIVGAVVLTLGLGVGLALGFNQFSKMPLPAAVTESAKPAGKAKPGAAPKVFLADNRSLAVFWVLLIVIAAGFMVLRYIGRPLGALPTLSQLADMKVLHLPGDHIAGLPAFIAGPGDDLTGMQLLVGVLGFAVIGTAVTSFGLAWLFHVLDATVKQGDKLPPTYLDTITADVLAVVERRKPVDALLPTKRVDRALLVIDGLLVVVTLAVMGVWVLSNQRVAAPSGENATAAPATSGQTGSTLEALKTEFAALPAGNAEGGQAVFSSAGCVACHSLEAGVKIVGPSLKSVVTDVPNLRPGYPPEIYFYESITQPGAYVVSGFQDGVMPKNFKTVLAPQQLADVIAFLMTQK